MPFGSRSVLRVGVGPDPRIVYFRHSEQGDINANYSG